MRGRVCCVDVYTVLFIFSSSLLGMHTEKKSTSDINN